MTITRRGLLLGGGLGLAAALAGCAAAEAPSSLRMACGEPGGTYVRFGGLLRDALRADDGTQLTVLLTDGSRENLRMLARREADLAIALADAVAVDAEPVAAIGRVYQNYLHCVTLRGSAVSGAVDLEGRRVSIGAPGSGAALAAERVLDALWPEAGVRAVDAVRLHLTDAVAALRAGRIDALFWSSGVPAPELASIPDLRLVDLAAALPAMERAFPGVYLRASIPSHAYGAENAVPVIGVPNLLLSRPELPDDLAGRLVDILMDDAERLIPAGSAGIQYLTASTLVDTAPVPLHPGAMRRYRERYG